MSDEYIRRQEILDAVEKLNIILSVYGTGKPTPTEDFRVQFLGTILHVPPADIAPVVHAYWIRHENADMFDGYEVPMFECSKCRAWKEDDSDFCPDCGAKMDAQGEET